MRLALSAKSLLISFFFSISFIGIRWARNLRVEYKERFFMDTQSQQWMIHFFRDIFFFIIFSHLLLHPFCTDVRFGRVFMLRSVWNRNKYGIKMFLLLISFFNIVIPQEHIWNVFLFRAYSTVCYSVDLHEALLCVVCIISVDSSLCLFLRAFANLFLVFVLFRFFLSWLEIRNELDVFHLSLKLTRFKCGSYSYSKWPFLFFLISNMPPIIFNVL